MFCAEEAAAQQSANSVSRKFFTAITLFVVLIEYLPGRAGLHGDSD
jgi:hypothetical protein